MTNRSSLLTPTGAPLGAIVGDLDASRAVSPSVVANTFMTQKANVTLATFARSSWKAESPVSCILVYP